ncbi:MAG: hypothetical protein SPF60_08150 [Lachnospiraceae bacterium]|nr:hypothetical protein [Lachnospiraceae bacterium]
MKKNRTVCHKEDPSLLNALIAYENAGIALTLGGRPASPYELARLCVIREKSCYMGDYIQDDDGNLTEIRFDKIRYQ